MACIRSNRFCACVQDKLCQFLANKQQNPQQILIKRDFTTSLHGVNLLKAQINGSLVRDISRKCQVNFVLIFFSYF